MRIKRPAEGKEVSEASMQVWSRNAWWRRCIDRYMPVDTYKRDAEQLCIEIDAAPPPQVAHMPFLLEQALEQRNFERDVYERFERKGFTLVTLGISMLTLIVAGIGTKALWPIACVPTFLCALFGVIEAIFSLRVVNVGSPRSVLEMIKRSAVGLDHERGQLNDLVLEAGMYRRGLALKVRHTKAAIWSFVFAAFCFMLPMLFAIVKKPAQTMPAIQVISDAPAAKADS